MFKATGFSFMVVASAMTATPATAQYMPHLDPNTYILATMSHGNGANTCMGGSPPPDNEIEEARAPAPGVMQAYFDTAQSGGVLSQSFRKSKKSLWSHNGSSVPYAQIDAQRDPLAMAGNRLEAEPLRFFRSGDFSTAHGQWSVMDASGSIVGVYDAQFKRQRGDWKLHHLSVLGADETVTPAMQYCAKPGDVADFKVETAGEQIENLENQIAKEERRMARDKVRLEKAQADFAENPKRMRYREAVRRELLTNKRREEKLTDLREALDDALEFQMKSQRDMTEIAAMTVAVPDALRLRGFELTTDKEAAEEKAAEEAEAAAE